jgi:LPXTG-motif cell wall-anchored protein
VGIVNRRNAVLGWSIWQITKRFASRKAKSVTPSAGGGRPNKSLLAVGIAGIAGALTFWRKRKGPSSPPS